MEHFFDALSELNEAAADRSKLEQNIWTTYGCRRAVLVMDSTGFTRVTESHGILHYLTLLLNIRRILTDVFDTHGSTRTRAVADNVFAEFSSVEKALEAAVAANIAVHEHQMMVTETEPFTLCIGIGFGDLLDAGEEGLFGVEMNFASRLGEDVAEGREILLTEAAFHALPSIHRSRFEERHAGFSGNSLKYYWTHWSP